MNNKNFLINQFKDMSIKPSDTVLIHTSMKAVGKTENGADGLIDAFCEYLSQGLFLVPTHTWNIVNEKQPVYNVKTSVPCIGIVPITAVKRKDGVRSLHPTHSICAFGKRATDYIKGEEKETTPASPKGCLGRLRDENAKILLIGVENNRNTYLHCIEEQLSISHRLSSAAYNTIIIDSQNKKISGTMRGHFSPICSDISANYVNFEKPFIALGAQTFGQLGNAVVRIIDVNKATLIVKNLWKKADYDLCKEIKDIPESYYK